MCVCVRVGGGGGGESVCCEREKWMATSTIEIMK